jgi:uncharacterized membrane protein YdfJ with MMPL/SSD domain
MSFRLLTAASAVVLTLSAVAAQAQDFSALAVQDLTKAELIAFPILALMLLLVFRGVVAAARRCHCQRCR